ncbi:MAG: YfjI family protein [Rickettsiales bacterium]|nr:YfjI family protein [Rickettsiales bacterium]
MNTTLEKQELQVFDESQAADIWPKPILFDDINTPDISPSLLPEPYSAFVRELATATETPPEMALACVLAMLSIAVTGKYEISPKDGWVESLNCYWFVEMSPANRKSKVMSECSKPALLWEREQYKLVKPIIERITSQNKTKEALIRKLRNKAAETETSPTDRDSLQKEIEEVEQSIEPVPAYPKLFANNVTPESLENYVKEQQGRFGIVSDEGGVIETLTGLYSGGKANVDIVLKGIDGGYIRVRRKDREFNLNPFLSIMLCVQPAIRGKMAENQNLQGNGALERFLYLIPKSQLGSRTHDKLPVSTQTREAYNQAIRKLLDISVLESESGGLLSRTLSLSSESYRNFHNFQLELEPKLRDGGELYPLQGWAGKIAGFIARIAGLIHLAKGLNEFSEVDIETMQAALKIGKALIEHAKTAYKLIGLEPTERNAYTVFKFLEGYGLPQISRSELTIAMKHNMKSPELTEALKDLEGRHIVSEHKEKGSGSRAITMYRISPRIHDAKLVGSSVNTESSSSEVSEAPETRTKNTNNIRSLEELANGPSKNEKASKTELVI